MSDSFIGLAIEQTSTTNFELWSQEVLSKEKGYRFEPTGGIHDGGQDGFVRAIDGEPSHYVQISKEQESSSKIRRTVNRLRKSRRIEKLTYVTSQNESERDLLEATLKRDLGIEVVIHDKRWLLIRAQIDENLKNSLYAYSKDLLGSVDI